MVKATGVVKATGSTSAFVINAGAGGAAAEMMLVWRAAMSRYSRVESANAAQRRGAVEHQRSEEREECASGRLAYAPVRTSG